MTEQTFRGVFTIPATPFTETGAIDWADFKRVLDFCVDCGAHGIVWPVNASGFAVLSDEERLQGMQVTVEQVAGRIPVILAVQGVSTPHAVMFSRQAQTAGADGVIAMAPYVQELQDEGAIMAYYQGINSAVDVPIFIQNHTRGSVLSIATMARLINEIEHVSYVKEETFPVTHMVSNLIEQVGPNLKGVFGGAGGRYLLLEHPRGVAGQMPGCHITDVVVRLWNALEAGDRTEAKRVYGLMAPLFALETVKGTYYPEVLRRRQVTKHAHSRLAVGHPTQDAYDHEALDEILQDLESLFTWNDEPVIYGVPSWIKNRPNQTSTQTISDQGAVDTFDQAG